MKWGKILFVAAIVVASTLWALHRNEVINLGGSSRIEELHAKSALYASEVLECAPGDKLTEGHLVVFRDVMTRLIGHQKTPDYIPEEVRAFTEKNVKYREEPTEATIAIGDTVEVLEVKKSEAGETFILVRTASRTYGWIADWHLNDENGNRLNVFKSP